MMKPEIIHCGAFRLTRDAKSKYWQVRAKAAPREPLWKSTGEENKTLAMKKAKQLYAEWANEKTLKPGEQILFRDLWREMVDDRSTFSKRPTIQRIETVGKKHLIPFFGNRFLGEVSALWPKFVREQKAKRPGTTLFNERKYLIALLTYGLELGLLDRVPTIPVLDGKPARFHVFTDEEIEKLVGGAGNELRLVIMLGFYQGMRAGEIAKLELIDVDLENWSIHIKDTKTKYDRTIGISEAVLPHLMAQYSGADSIGSRWLFPQVHNPAAHKDQRVHDKAWQRLKRTLGITGRFHDLRHSCATRFGQSKDLTPQQACAFLGMSLRVYDKTYCHLGLEQTRIASTVISLPNGVDFGVENAADA